jgi:aspartate dehydrogenase
MKIAFVGLGAIGEAVLRCLSSADPSIEVLGALVAAPARARACRVFSSVDALLEARPEVVVECARQPVLKAVGPRILRSGTTLIAASVGALAEECLLLALTEAAQSGGGQLVVPAGALAGIDALAAARRVGISSVHYTRRAPPAMWIKSGALEAGDALAAQGPHTVFEGAAREAARRFPKNANVAATVALAGIGFERTRVSLIADPAAHSNVHVIEAEGEFGRLRTELSARPIAGSTSSRIVAGSLTRAIVSRLERISV